MLWPMSTSSFVGTGQASSSASMRSAHSRPLTEMWRPLL